MAQMNAEKNNMKAKSIKGNSFEEIQAALQFSMKDGFKPTLAIVFISIKQDRKSVCELLKKEGIDIFGATSCGEFIDGYQGEGSITILLMDVPKNCYAVLFEDIGNGDIKEAANRMAQEALKKFRNVSLVLCSTGINTKAELFDGSTLVQTIKKALGHDRSFFGGMAGDDMTFTGSYVFTENRETDCGMAAIVFDADKINMSGMAITGWKPMGICRTVTKSAGKKIFTIDGVSAVEMYFKYLGKEEKKTDQNFKVFEELGFTYPFITEREPGGDMILKTPVKIDHQENALIMDMEMPEGTKFWFSMPPDFDIVDEILDEATRLKNSNSSGADALLIFSCAGRQPVLGPLATAENEGLANVWKTPMAGFFTYGKYGRTKKGKQEFHSGACCWVVLKEK
jgi:hypothetical protein